MAKLQRKNPFRYFLMNPPVVSHTHIFKSKTMTVMIATTRVIKETGYQIKNYDGIQN